MTATWNHRACGPCNDGRHDACAGGPAIGRRFETNRPPCACRPAGHTLVEDGCYAHVSASDGWGDGHRCGRRVTGRGPSWVFSGTFEVALCGIHLAALRKRAERDARWAAESAERQRVRDAEAALRDETLPSLARRLDVALTVHDEHTARVPIASLVGLADRIEYVERLTRALDEHYPGLRDELANAEGS